MSTEITKDEILNAIETSSQTLEMMRNIIQRMKPVYDFGLVAMQSTDTYSMKEAADLLGKKTGLGRNLLFEWLRAEGILLNTPNYWNQPARQYIERGYFAKAEKATPVGIKMVTLATNRGIEFIMRSWDERNTA